MRRGQHATVYLDQQRRAAVGLDHVLRAREAVQVECCKQPQVGIAHGGQADELDDRRGTERSGVRLQSSAREAGDLDTVPRERRAVDDASVDETLDDKALRFAGVEPIG